LMLDAVMGHALIILLAVLAVLAPIVACVFMGVLG